jgi:hypothetical protein
MSAARSAAVQFETAGAYATFVLDKPARTSSTFPGPTHGGEADGVFSVAGAVAIACFVVSPRMRTFSILFEKPVAFLHRLHSGHPGDYVTFPILGMACSGLICAYCMQ